MSKWCLHSKCRKLIQRFVGEGSWRPKLLWPNIKNVSRSIILPKYVETCIEYYCKNKNIVDCLSSSNKGWKNTEFNFTENKAVQCEHTLLEAVLLIFIYTYWFKCGFCSFLEIRIEQNNNTKHLFKTLNSIFAHWTVTSSFQLQSLISLFEWFRVSGVKKEAVRSNL